MRILSTFGCVAYVASNPGQIHSELCMLYNLSLFSYDIYVVDGNIVGYSNEKWE